MVSRRGMRQMVSRRLAALGCCMLLSGCGFQPVYMPTASGKPGVAQRELSAVYVGIIPDRPGQVLRQALQERFGNDSGTPPAYDLNVSFSVSGEGIAIESDTIATRIRLIGSRPGAWWAMTPSGRCWLQAVRAQWMG